jgi:uncharacterized membrane protein
MAFLGYIKALFADADNTFSWRKAMTAIVSVTFAACCIGFAFFAWVRELPAAYTAIIAGVFIFYFGKDVISKIGIKSE